MRAQLDQQIAQVSISLAHTKQQNTFAGANLYEEIATLETALDGLEMTAEAIQRFIDKGRGVTS